MALTNQSMVGNWVTHGNQEGWSYPASGQWKGNLVVSAGGTTTMRFTDGNIAPTRSGNWSLNGNKFSIIDTEGTRWMATVAPNGSTMSGPYDSGPPGAGDGSWGARKL
ncbi:hypothetical protein GCM10009127_17450 [Alteraurantiacibacter aestuarii]|uniref:Uncharacterized protein n=1 Tax=Alteraurantiacibacter aestuarii TaxID=650004 RepID=A0A844ZPW2_9SPHN|nr:hypothetical protein [Alteraurantiacibacter aestuarii]MXO87669.1 hypothetical protein [Alteraurantiacibacter aestuarii]